MWSYFKNVWRRMLYDINYTITDKNSKDHMRIALKMVEMKGEKLARGPLKHMISYC